MSQKVLVAGTGISGIAAAKLLLAQGGEVVLYDGNEKLSAEELKKNFDVEQDFDMSKTYKREDPSKKKNTEKDNKRNRTNR